MKALIISILITCWNLKPIHSQSTTEIDAYNTYIQFLNESVHGLFTAHALLVISNKEVNRYIDLESYILNNISNDEVQSHLFDKSDKENYTTFHTYSPLELSRIAKEKSRALPAGVSSKLNKEVSRIVEVLNAINKIRIEVDAFINDHDLNEKESIYGVFEILERAVQLFNQYASAHHRLYFEIQKLIDNPTDDRIRTSHELHNIIQSVLLELRKEDDSAIGPKINTLRTKFDEFNLLFENAADVKQNIYKQNVKVKVDRIIELLNTYENPGTIPVEYELYGKHYYYHNEIAKRYYNWSGPGFVRYLNNILDDLGNPFVKMLEEPVIFKVVYPMKKVEAEELVENSPSKEIKSGSKTKTPKRNLKFSTPPITYDSNILSLEIYDHNMIDHDSISISLNGEWIIENYALTAQPKIFEIELEDNIENLLVFHANNLGIRAPNTVAIAYRYKGQRKRVYLESDLNYSETLKITLEKP